MASHPKKAAAYNKIATSQLVIAPWRQNIVFFLFLASVGLLVARAIYLQIIDSNYLQSQGDTRYLRVHKKEPMRGMIMDRHGQPLAISSPVDSIWVQPDTILKQQASYSYQQLTTLLSITREQLLDKCRRHKERSFIYLKRHVMPQLASRIISLNIPGVNAQREYKRYYPTGPLFSHVLGFTNIDNQGQEGIELAFNKALEGKPGFTRVLVDRYGRVVEHVEQINPVQPGGNLRISLDARIQYLASRHLHKAVQSYQAVSGSLVVLDTRNGEILAMVNAPNFNPNNRATMDSEKFRNRAITDVFEPGSTIKPFTVAMAMENNLVTPETIIDTSPGFLKLNQTVINDERDYGKLLVGDVIRKSSNVGAATIALKTSPGKLFRTYQNLGFGESSGLPLNGEQTGSLWLRRHITGHVTMAYGYGLSVNAVQLVRSYTAIANDGRLLPVAITLRDEPVTGRQVFSQSTTEKLKVMMAGVVSQEGTAPLAKIDRYRVAGKTGTVHLVSNGRYLDDNFIAAFVGFAPLDDPQMAIVVVIRDPRGDSYHGGTVAAPVFARVMAGALRLRAIDLNVEMATESIVKRG